VEPVEGTDERVLKLPSGYAYPRNPEAYMDRQHIFEDQHAYEYHPKFAAANQL